LFISIPHQFKNIPVSLDDLSLSIMGIIEDSA